MNKKTFKVNHVFTRLDDNLFKDVCTSQNGQKDYEQVIHEGTIEIMLRNTVKLLREQKFNELIINAEITQTK